MICWHRPYIKDIPMKKVTGVEWQDLKGELTSGNLDMRKLLCEKSQCNI